MAKVYTSTIELKCWKEHTCADCGGLYAYPFARTIKGQAPTAEAASIRAQNAAQKSLAEDVDLHPCPTCGTFQPDMIGQKRSGTHRWVFWLALVAFGILLITRASDGLRANTATWAITGVCALALVLHGSAELRDINKDREANRRLAAERVTAGSLQYQAGRPAAPGMVRGSPLSTMGMLGLLMLLAAVGAAAAPELLRSMRHWPLNDSGYPPVIGPGDHTWVYMPQKISSVKGYWRGDSAAVLTDAAGHRREVHSEAKDNNWGSSINAKSSEKSQGSTPWVRVDLPDDASLAGQKMTCDIVLDIQYPQAQGSSSFDVIRTEMHQNVPLELASPHAGTKYNAWWWEGTVAAVVLVFLAGILLGRSARSMRSHAKPTRTFA